MGSICSASSICHQAHRLSAPERWRVESNRLFRENLFGAESNGASDLYFYWHIAYPAELKKLEANRFLLTPSHKRMRIYQNDPDPLAENPLKPVNTFMGTQDVSNIQLVEAFLKNFKNRATPETEASIREIEKLIATLANPRQGFGYVSTAPAEKDGRLIGTFRFFNGSPSHSDTPADLPFEYEFRQLEIQTKSSALVQKLREDPNAVIFEIGKLSIQAKSSIAKRVRNLLELFWLRYYVDTYTADAQYFVHCDSLAHVEHYERRYGLRLIETVPVPQLRETHFILSATGTEIRQALQKHHPIPSRGIEILKP